MKPRIGIGLVVRNGAKHLAEAIQSLRDQTYGNFELTIYDNASTDRTPRIAERYAALDDRVKLVRHAHDLGAIGNYVHAAKYATTDFFCWAAHDDRREPNFLATLLTMLEGQPNASLACGAVRDMNPEGKPCGIRPETASLESTHGMTVLQRLRNFFRDAPATPIYGLFRTAELKQHLDILRNAQQATGSIPFGVDVAFLASFWRDHDVEVTREPLLCFRQGGASHQLESMDRVSALATQLLAFRQRLTFALGRPNDTMINAWRLTILRDGYLKRLLLTPPLRRIMSHAVLQSWPILRPLHARWTCRMNATFARLQRRCASLPHGSIVAIFGAGKHTKRWIHVFRHVLARRAFLTMIADDAAGVSRFIDGIPVVAADELRNRSPDVIIVSSDCYEASLHRRAQSLKSPATKLWCIYDETLEQASDRSSTSIDRRTPSIQSMASSAA